MIVIDGRAMTAAEAVDYLAERQGPWTAQRYVTGRTIAETISDRHVDGASRETIAAWIATLEPTEPVVEPVVPVEEVPHVSV